MVRGKWPLRKALRLGARVGRGEPEKRRVGDPPPGEPMGGRVHPNPSFHRVSTPGPGEQRVGKLILGAP